MLTIDSVRWPHVYARVSCEGFTAIEPLCVNVLDLEAVGGLARSASMLDLLFLSG